MKKVLAGLLAAAAIGAALPAAASAVSVAPGVICASCDGGGPGWTGCTQQTADHSAGLPYLSHVRHYLVVSYCKHNGWITSISIAAFGADMISRPPASLIDSPSTVREGAAPSRSRAAPETLTTYPAARRCCRAAAMRGVRSSSEIGP